MIPSPEPWRVCGSKKEYENRCVTGFLIWKRENWTWRIQSREEGALNVKACLKFFLSCLSFKTHSLRYLLCSYILNVEFEVPRPHDTTTVGKGQEKLFPFSIFSELFGQTAALIFYGSTLRSHQPNCSRNGSCPIFDVLEPNIPREERESKFS